jgi:hypothetical protein
MFRRNRFGDLIDRQLRLFAEDHADRLERIRLLRAEYAASSAEDAEGLYGDYADELDWAAEELAALRDAYSATLDEDSGERYLREFSRLARRSFPEFAGIADAL